MKNNNFIKWILNAILVIFPLVLVNGQTVATTTKQPLKIMPLSEVKAGMKGVAKTVFSGSKPEEFGVEILGISEGFVGPRQDGIIIKLSGKNAERTFVFAGMSGSPVYVDGKLIGAIAYSFPFAKEPLGAVTPIEQMISIFEKNENVKAQSKEPRSYSFKELASTELNFGKFSKVENASFIANLQANSPLVPYLGQPVARIATPLIFGGMSQATINYFAPQLSAFGFMPVATTGGTSKISPMKKETENSLMGGDSVVMHLTRGDYNLGAFGTVTARDGDKVYAFGHPFLNLGVTDLPMAESSVITVVPNANNSFKIGVVGDMVGSMGQDRATGVFGKIGKAPKMIPVKINFQTSRGQNEVYDFEIASDDFLSPLLLNISIFNTIQANERNIGDTTTVLDGTVNVVGQQPIKIERRFSGNNATAMTAGSVAVPVNILLDSGFEGIDIKNVNLNISSIDGRKTATLEKISLDKLEVKAGDSFEIQAFVRTNQGKDLMQRIPVKIPKDTPVGTLLINVGDGGSIQRISTERFFVPNNVGELIKSINEIRKSDRLYVQLVRVTNGAVIGAKELPNLPPSVLATLNNDRIVGGVTPTVLSFFSEQEVPPAEFIIAGNQVLTIDVVK